jgi:hypothetical protein
MLDFVSVDLKFCDIHHVHGVGFTRIIYGLLISTINSISCVYTVGSSVSALSGLYTTVMKASGASRRVFQLLDRTSSMPNSGDKCPIKLVSLSISFLEWLYLFNSSTQHL